MAITRQLTRIVLKEVVGLPQFDTGHTLTLRRDDTTTLCTATETSDGNYAFTWTAEDSYGYFYVDGTPRTDWGHLWFGESTGDQNLDNEFHIAKPATLASTLNVAGATTLAASLSGVVHAAAGVISASPIVDADVSSSAAIAWGKVSKVGSNLTDIATRNHNDLSSIQGGTSNEYYHLTSAEYTGVGSGVFVRATNPALSGAATITGSISASGAITAASLSASGVIAGASLSASGALTLGGSAHIVGSAQLNSTLSVTGAITGASLSASGAITGLSFSGSGSLTLGGSALAGVAQIGNTSGYAEFAHSSTYGSTGYALLQGGDGSTYLNAASGTSICFRINNATYITLNASGNVQAFGAVLFGSTFGVSGAATLSSSAHIVGDSTLDGNITLATAKKVSNNYSFGVFGAGYQLDQNITVANQSYMEIDNLNVRGTLYANVFKYKVVNCTNGTLFISDSTTVPNATTFYGMYSHSYGYYCSVKEPVFATNDIILFSDLVIGSGLSVTNRYVRAATPTEMLSIIGGGHTQMESDGAGLYRLFYISLDTVDRSVSPGATLVRVGNASDTTRQGSIFFDSSTLTGYPYQDIYNGRTSTATVAPQVRLGWLGTITDTINGVSASGYGLYSQNAFLKGGIVATFGQIGGWYLGSTTLSSSASGILLDAANEVISIHSGSVKMFVSGSTYGISGSGFQLGSTNNIAGWTFDTGKFNNGTDIVLNAGTKTISVYNGAVKMFFSSSSSYGVSGSGFQLGSTNQIGAWGFNGGLLSMSSNVYLGDNVGANDGTHRILIGNNSAGLVPIIKIAGSTGKYILFADNGSNAYGQIADGTRNIGFGEFAPFGDTGNTGNFGLFMKDAGGYNFVFSDTIKQIAGWGFDFSKFSSSGNVGGTDGGFTTSGIVLSKDGWMSAPAFALGSSVSKIAGFTFNTTTLSGSGSGSQIIGGMIRTAAVGQTRVELDGVNNALNFVHATSGSDDFTSAITAQLNSYGSYINCEVGIGSFSVHNATGGQDFFSRLYPGDIIVSTRTGIVTNYSIELQAQTTEQIKIHGLQILTTQQAAVAHATSTADVVARLNDLIDRCRSHGLISL